MILRLTPRCIALAFALLACNDQPSTAPAAEKTLGITLSSAAAPADGATIVTLLATIPPDSRADRRSITFSTNAGTLTEGNGKEVTIVADVAGRALVGLRAPQDAGAARVRVAVSTVVVRDTVVAFVVAAAERVDVEPERFVVKANGTDEVRISAVLRRAVGRATTATMVTFAATDSLGQPIGRVSGPVPSDANGVATARFFAGTTSYRGRVTITATATGAGNAAVSGSTTIDVIS